MRCHLLQRRHIVFKTLKDMLYTKHLKAEKEHKSMQRARLNLDLLSIY